nr:MFS transporter [uncultured Massilia sp.]
MTGLPLPTRPMRTLIQSRSARHACLLAGILLIAANLRAPFTALPPLLATVRADLGLGTVGAGALTTLPLLVFAIVSPFGARLVRAFGLERALAGALAAIAAGVLLRSAGPAGWLYLGTGLAGAGIAVGNVLLPSLVKRDFPDDVAALTGAYALAAGLVAALGSAAVAPLAQAWGWRAALAAFAVLPAVALLAWLALPRAQAGMAAGAPARRQGPAVWRSALAWQVTLFLGLNSTVYYIAIGWLPTILADAGVAATRAGSLHGILQLASAVPGLLLGPLLRRLRDQRLPAAGAALLAAVALAGLQLAPQWAGAWVAMFGLGSGASFILGLAFVGLRTGNAQQAAALSGMAQCAGYLLAAAGPMAIGALHDALGGWDAPLGACVALALAMAGAGVLAGRNVRIPA